MHKSLQQLVSCILATVTANSSILLLLLVCVSWTITGQPRNCVFIGGVLTGFVTGIQKDSVHRWNLWFPSAGVFAEVLRGRRLPSPQLLNMTSAILTKVDKGCSCTKLLCQVWNYIEIIAALIYELKLHTIERFDSRQLRDPVFIFENDVTKVTNIESIMLVLQCFNTNNPQVPGNYIRGCHGTAVQSIMPRKYFALILLQYQVTTKVIKSTNATKATTASRVGEWVYIVL